MKADFFLNMEFDTGVYFQEAMDSQLSSIYC